MFCKNCGKEIDDNAVICVHCGVATGVNNTVVNDEHASTALKVVSILFPLVGLILFLVYNEKQPTKAKECGKFALYGVAISVVLFLISSCSTAMMISDYYY